MEYETRITKISASASLFSFFMFLFSANYEGVK
jgi:hypothetical protein